jgi:hypothetical protein
MDKRNEIYLWVKKVAESCQTPYHVQTCNKLIDNLSAKYKLEWLGDEAISLLRDIARKSCTKSLLSKTENNPSCDHVLFCVKTELLDPESTTITINKVDDGKVEIFVNGAYTGRHKL